jgi:dephospho-CoA kinase
MAFVLGITGGIGTGKSTVLRMFQALGAQTLSADDLARDVLAKDEPAYLEVVQRFGPGVVADDGQIDRAALGDIVFGDPEARQALNSITHPRIIGLLRQRIAEFRQGAGTGNLVMAVEIPLLIECGLECLVDEVLLVAAEQRTQVSRLTTVGHLSMEQALGRIYSQMPTEEKLKRADRVIWNDSDLGFLEDSVKRIWGEILLL